MDPSSTDLAFPALGGPAVIARFDGGTLTSDAGLLLLAQADRKLKLTEQLAPQIVDRREDYKSRRARSSTPSWTCCASASTPSPPATKMPTIWTA